MDLTIHRSVHGWASSLAVAVTRDLVVVTDPAYRDPMPKLIGSGQFSYAISLLSRRKRLSPGVITFMWRSRLVKS